MKKILVTGGAGFVGSHLCARLVYDGYQVICLDNYFTGSRDNRVRGVEYREGHSKNIETLVPEQVDLVFHLGEYSRVEKSLEDPIELVWDLNAVGTFAVLEYCRKQNCKIVYAGSSSKFSDRGLGRDLAPYTWMKAANTELVCNYGKWFGLPFAITYFYNVYGPGEINHGPYSTLLGIFCEEHRQGQPLTVVSPGSQERNFTHVDDIVEGLILVGLKGLGDEFGIGAAEVFSVIDVARMFGGEIVMLPERRGNRQTSTVNTEKISALGWRQKHRLDEYVKQFVQETKRAKALEKNVLVFSTTFAPVIGPAEEALIKLMRLLPDVHFDVITAAFSPEAKAAPSPLPNVSVYRLGNGKWYDKYLLPFYGARQAKKLLKNTTYVFGWALMASYAALAAVPLRKKTGLPILISLADQKLERLPFYYRLLLSLILKNADQVSIASGEQESYASRLKLNASNRLGDVFVNQLRFVYNSILKEVLMGAEKKV